uniref:Uncharacterized protein n=1 Tax=Arundo donax TaxID=35708 RepID=A0A0A9FL36_ARUDO
MSNSHASTAETDQNQGNELKTVCNSDSVNVT